jgi:hypothetical protein
VGGQALYLIVAAAIAAIAPRTHAWRDGERVAETEPGQRFPLASGVLLGEIALAADWSDYRGQPIARGRYELRYAVQPRLKDHAGADAIRDFALLVPRGLPASTDWIAASRRISRTRHPAVLAIVPWEGSGAAPAEAVREADRTVLYRQVGDLMVGFVVAGRAPPPEAF